MNMINSKIKDLIAYLENNYIKNSLIDISKENSRSEFYFRYDPDKSILTYNGWETSYHNGDSYSEVTEDFTVLDVPTLEKIHDYFYKLSLVKAEKELDIIKRKKEDARIKKEIQDFLDSKIKNNSTRFITINNVPELALFVRDACYSVEATDFEMLTLWEKYSKRKYPLSTNIASKVESVPNYYNKPINVEFVKYTYRGMEIISYRPTSSVVDWEMIEEFLTKHNPIFKKNKTDAINFHHCIHYIDDIVDANSVKFINKET